MNTIDDNSAATSTESKDNEVAPIKMLVRVLACTMVTCIVTEIFLRLFITAPSRQLFDPELGWRYKPNSTLVHSGEGYATHQLNELGLNDVPLKNKINPTKVLISGDSFVEALEVKRAANFVSRLNQNKPSIDFINGGRGDFTPLHQLVVLNRLEQYIRPTMNLLFISMGDIGSILSTPVQIERNANGELTHLTLINPSKDALKDKFRIILHNSALATYLMRRYHQEMKDFITFAKEPCIFNCNEEKLNSEKSSTIIDIETAELERFSYVLKKLNQRVPTTVFYIPTVFYHAKRVSTISEYSLNETRLIEIATKNTGTPFHNLAPLFQADYENTGVPAFGFHNTRVGGEGHLNEHGHIIVANYIEQSIELFQ